MRVHRKVLAGLAASAILMTTAVVGASASQAATDREFVAATDIRPDEATYPGWHQGYPVADPDLGTYAAVKNADGITTGLKVTGKTQVLRGLEAATSITNGIGAAKNAKITLEPGTGPVQAQFATLYVPVGSVAGTAPKFTTIYTTIPASGDLNDATAWSSSRDLLDGTSATVVPGHQAASYSEVLSALGSHSVVGYGFQLDLGSSTTVSSYTYNGFTTNFADVDALAAAAELASNQAAAKTALDALVDSKGALLPGVTLAKLNAAKAALTALPTTDALVAPLKAAIALAEAALKVVTDACMTPSTIAKFADVNTTQKFFTEINWMGCKGYSKGNINPAGGKSLYAPKDSLTREAMATFMFRYAKPSYTAPATSPFADVKPTDKFYKEISWMKSAGLSTGTKSTTGGLPTFAPKSNLSREAMAAFIYRYVDSKAPQNFTAPKTAVFSDMKAGDKFYKEASWMKAKGLSTGTKNPAGGLPFYAPKTDLSREAMAAFLYRLSGKSF